MYSRKSIYDRLQPRAVRPTRAEPLAAKRFDTQSMIIADAWMMGGFGNIDELDITGVAPSNCDYAFDTQLVDAQGCFIGVARIETPLFAEPDPLDRAYQLLENALPELIARQAGTELQVVLQLPADVQANDWLDAALELWPIQAQPKHGITTTSLTLDQWLSTTLSIVEAEVERYQFISVAPVAASASGSLQPLGEAVGALWLQRERENEAEKIRQHPSLRLTLPSRQAHISRKKAGRRDVDFLKDTVRESLNERASEEDFGLLVWDGRTEANRLDHLIALIQGGYEHLFLDTDVWSLERLTGVLNADSFPFLVITAAKLAENREQNVLVLDTRAEEETLAMPVYYLPVEPLDSDG